MRTLTRCTRHADPRRGTYTRREQLDRDAAELRRAWMLWRWQLVDDVTLDALTEDHRSESAGIGDYGV